MKRCPGCDTIKPFAEFYVRRSTGKPQSYCIACTKAGATAWAKAHPEENLARIKRWQASLGEDGRKRHREHAAEWGKRNIVRRRELNRLSYHRHKERLCAERKAKYQQRKSEKPDATL